MNTAQLATLKALMEDNPAARAELAEIIAKYQDATQTAVKAPAPDWQTAYKGEPMEDFLDALDTWTDSLESLAEVDAEAAARVLKVAADALEKEVGAVSATVKAMHDPAFQAEVARLVELKSRGPGGQFQATVAALGF